VAAAERYIRSAWQLRSIAEIGDHLGQVYEKLGRKQDAATMYALSIATGSPMPETEARLTALVGKNTDIKQLAQDARNKSVAVKNERDLDGEAEFWLLLERGPKVSASKFIGGEGSRSRSCRRPQKSGNRVFVSRYRGDQASHAAPG
jgi:hypothetical protein